MKQTSRYHKMTISLPKVMDRFIKELSSEMNITKSAFIRLAIHNYLNVTGTTRRYDLHDKILKHEA